MHLSIPSFCNNFFFCECERYQYTIHVIPVYTIQPVVKPVVQPVWQPAVSCKQTSNRLSNRYSRLSNQLYNRLNEQLLFVQHGCQTGLTTSLTTGCIGLTTGWMFIYTIQCSFIRLYNRFDNRLYTRYSQLSDRLSNGFDNQLSVCIHDNRSHNRLYCVYKYLPGCKTIWEPVGQKVVSCKRGLRISIYSTKQ